MEVLPLEPSIYIKALLHLTSNTTFFSPQYSNKMADLMNKIKETLVPSNTENSNTGSHQESHNSGSLQETYNTSSHNTESFNNTFNNTNQNNQRELGSNSHISPLDATSNQNQQTEGVRTGDRIDSLVENVPGVPSSQSKPS